MHGVLTEHFGHGHLDRAIVLDHDNAARDGHLAIGERVKGVDQLFSTDTLRRLQFNLDVFRGEIIDAPNLQFALASRVLNGCNHGFGRCARRDLLDHDRGVILHLHLGANLDGAFAICIIAGIHQAPSLKVRQALERLLFQNGDLRFEEFGKVVGQNAGRHADRDAFRSEHQGQR